jgi:hypothetical protein
MWHSGWANACATPEQLRKILNGKFDFPNAGDVVKHLDKAHQTGTFFLDTHKASWKHLNSYTHTGKNQLLARMTGTDLEPSYSDYEKIFVLDATRICAAMTAILTLKAHGRIEDAAKILPALTRGGYVTEKQQVIGKRYGGGIHKVDAIATRDGERVLVSLKWQQTGGTAEQKVPFEVVCLADAVTAGHGNREFLVLGGDGWKLRDYFTSGKLSEHLIHANLVKVVTLEAFIGIANNGKL